MYALPYLLLQWLRHTAINARRRHRTVRYLWWSVLAGLASATMLVFAAAFVAFLWAVGMWWLAIVMLGVLVVPVLASTAIRHVLVPLGYSRVAYQAGLYSRPGPDAGAYALCVAAWAARDGAAVAWVSSQRELRRPLG